MAKYRLSGWEKRSPETVAKKPLKGIKKNYLNGTHLYLV